MKISQSLTVEVTNETFVNFHSTGKKYYCTFIGNQNENLNISFDKSCIYKLSELIQKLQEVYQFLIQDRQQQLVREFNLLSLPTSALRKVETQETQEEEISF